MNRKSAIRAATVVVGAAAVAGAAWIALPADAATTGVVKVTGTGANVINYTAAAGKTNTVVLTLSGNTVTVDDVYGITAGTGCVKVSGDVSKIRCTTKTAPLWVQVDVGDGNDTVINNTGLSSTIWGRAGNDKLTGGPRRDILRGGDGADAIWALGGDDELYGEGGADALSGGDSNVDPGNVDIYGSPLGDTIFGGAAGDRLLGGNGIDYLLGEAGNDVEDGGADDDYLIEDYDYAAGTDMDAFVGGTGFDRVAYIARTKNVTADADSVKGDDGAAGEKDTIGTSVEGIQGGFGNDKLLGTAANEVFWGDLGNDVIAAGSGDDYIEGNEGVDWLNGAGGDYDTCTAATNPDFNTGGDTVQPGETVLGCEYEPASALAKKKAAAYSGNAEALRNWVKANH